MKKIEFVSTVSGVSDLFPIKQSKDVLPKWVNSAKQNYSARKKATNGRLNHIYQCPGIFDVMNQGYVVPMWHDVIINTNGDPDAFSWTVPTNELVELVPDTGLIENQSNGIGNLMPSKPWSLNSLIKINTPWNVIAPRGVKLLILPVPYPDSFEFESSIGILDPGYSNEINLQMYYNVPQGDFTIKAGTPLAQIIPLSEQKFQLVCREMNSLDKLWIRKRKFFMSATFKIKRNRLKELYYEHFGAK